MEEAVYFLTHEPTVSDLRQLNRDGTTSFALPMLMALISAGVDVKREQEAIVSQRAHIGDVVEMRWHVLLQGKLIAILGESGADDFRVIARRRKNAADPA